MANNLEVVVRVRDLTTQGLARITQSITRMGSSVLRWGAAFAGISGSLSLVQFTKFASTLEDLEGRLAGVFEGDFEAAADQLERIRALAADPIVGTEELVDTFIKGATSIRNFSEETLNTLANVSVQFDRDIGTVFSAFAGASERSLRTLGVSLEKVGNIARITSGDMRVEVENTTAAIQEGLVEVWSTRFPNAVEDAGKRFSGALKIFQDAVQDLGAEIGEKILPRITASLNELTAWVNDNDDAIIGFAEDAATAVGEFSDAVIDLAKGIKDHETEWRLLAGLGAAVAIGFGGAKAKIAGTMILLQQYLHFMNKLPVQGQYRAAPPGPGEWYPPMLLPDAEAPFKTGGLGVDFPPRIPQIPGVTASASRSGGAGAGTVQDKSKDVRVLITDLDNLEISLGRIPDAVDRSLVKMTDFSDALTSAMKFTRAEIDLTQADMDDFVSQTISDVKTAFTDDFAQGLADMMNGVASFEDSWKGAVTSVLEGLQQIILKMILMAAYQRFIAPLLGGIFGAATGTGVGAVTAGALTAPASFMSGQTIVVQSTTNFHAGFVDPTGADEFFARNSSRFKEMSTAATVEALERSPAFRARVRR